MNRIIPLALILSLCSYVATAKEVIVRSDDDCFKITINGSAQSLTYDPPAGKEEQCRHAQEKATTAMKYYELGHNAHIEGNIKEAVRYYSKASEHGEFYAPYLLANMYINGEGVRKDVAIAIEWYQKAAQNGMPAGYFNLGSVVIF
ncbi:MAG: sel1 repeat family protein [Rickettsiales bacterium]|nr:sel1 repeat family protein [Rickettsiales bacterium]